MTSGRPPGLIKNHKTEIFTLFCLSSSDRGLVHMLSALEHLTMKHQVNDEKR